MSESPSYFLDITPVLRDAYGSFHELGVVRYVISDPNISSLATPYRYLGMNGGPIHLPGHGPQYGCDIVFNVVVTSVDVPQPEPLPSVEHAPEPEPRESRWQCL